MSGSEETVHFRTGGLQIEGRVAVPPTAKVAAVICHPHPQYGGDMNNNVVLAVATSLQRAGVATLRFNFRGVGASEGSYAGGRGEADDARGAVKFLGGCVGVTTVALAGYSFGALVALRAGHDHAHVSHLAAIAPPVSMFDVGFLSGCAKPKLFVLGDRDQYCPLATLERCVADLVEPKSLHRMSGADHFFGGREAQVAELVTAFLTEA